MDPLGSFHPLVAAWFRACIGEPTLIQRLAWPDLASGGSRLLIAPTGSGKTLASFLPALDRLAKGEWPADSTTILYVSPLKALNTDIGENLLKPLAGMREAFTQAGLEFPDVRVAVRSGDTPQGERRKMLKKRPSILVTTPESLSIMLRAASSRAMLAGVRYAIIDEVHAVASSKRGSLLACALGRLASLAGSFQRVAVSATVGNPGDVAVFMGLEPGSILKADMEKRYELRVETVAEPGAPGLAAGGSAEPDSGIPGAPEDFVGLATTWPPQDPRGAGVWQAAARKILPLLEQNRSTLVFVKARRHAERLAYLVNELAGEDIAYAHHGSLSRELRHAVESRMRAGSLKAIVATSSLELGIDVGSIDTVVMVGSPAEASQCLQRLGRAGHGVGLASRGVLLPLHGADFLAAAALSRAVEKREVERIPIPRAPLDILAQELIALAATEPAAPDALYAKLRRWAPYKDLSRPAFDAVLSMLEGRYEDSRIKELKPRLRRNPDTGLVEARDGSLALLNRAGGSIPDRGYYALRVAGSRASLGELDEEFVWERRLGDRISIGNQAWTIVHIDDRAVEVRPSGGGQAMSPFWKADPFFRGREQSERVLAILEESASWAGPEDAEDALPGFSSEAAARLHAWLASQRGATGLPLPGPGRVVYEYTRAPESKSHSRHCVLHAFRGGRCLYPYALALGAALDEAGVAARVMSDDDSVLVLSLDPEGTLPSAPELAALVPPGRAEELLARGLEASGLFGAVFRHCAGRAILLPRAGFKGRVPLWLTRQRSKTLFRAVAPYGDFPIAAEAWRECREDIFDMEAFIAFAEGLHSGSIRALSCETAFPSPFCAGLAWQEINSLLYESDEMEGGRAPSVRDEVLREALAASSGIPPLDPAILGRWIARRRAAPEGFSSFDALDWLEDRLAVPSDEWETELAKGRMRLPRDEGRIQRRHAPGAAVELVMGRDTAASFDTALAGGELGAWAARWAVAAGGSCPSELAALFGLGLDGLDAFADGTEGGADGDADAAVLGGPWPLAEGPLPLARMRLGEGLLLAPEILDYALRLQRKARAPEFPPHPASFLAPFLAKRQGLSGRLPPGREGLEAALELLAGLPLEAALWERSVLPLRVPGYEAEWLELLVGQGPLVPFGTEGELCFAIGEGLPLFLSPVEAGDLAEAGKSVKALHRAGGRPVGLLDLAREEGLDTASMEAALWEEFRAGRASLDSMRRLRRAIEDGEAVRKPRARPDAMAGSIEAERAARGQAMPHGRARRPVASFAEWRARRGPETLWRSLVPLREGRGIEALEVDRDDLVDSEELSRERVRLLAARHGVLCRPLLERELPPLRWKALSKSMARMELSGELAYGRFFDGVEGPQYALSAELDEIKRFEPEPEPLAMAAKDPASPSGLGLYGLPYEAPQRAPGCALCLWGPELVIVSRKGGAELDVLTPPGDPRLGPCLARLDYPLRRAVEPERRLAVELINGEAALGSPYRAALEAAGYRPGYKALEKER
jgi:ATP-dependent Lhr-like helicase